MDLGGPAQMRNVSLCNQLLFGLGIVANGKTRTEVFWMVCAAVKSGNGILANAALISQCPAESVVVSIQNGQPKSEVSVSKSEAGLGRLLKPILAPETGLPSASTRKAEPPMGVALAQDATYIPPGLFPPDRCATASVYPRIHPFR